MRYTWGYSGELGSKPKGFGGDSENYLKIQGTVAPTVTISSMPFTPNESYEALVYYQSNKEICHEKYGLLMLLILIMKGDNGMIKILLGLIKVLKFYRCIII